MIDVISLSVFSESIVFTTTISNPRGSKPNFWVLIREEVVS